MTSSSESSLTHDICLAIERGLEVTRALLPRLPSAALALDWAGLGGSTVETGNLPFRAPAEAGRRFIPFLLANSDCPVTA